MQKPDKAMNHGMHFPVTSRHDKNDKNGKITAR